MFSFCPACGILCCLPVVTAGAATTALYYVTLKMARGQEGQLIPAFFHSFKQNLKQATALWVGYLAVGILLVLDLVICLQTSSVFAGAMFFTSVVLLACWALFITMLFPLVARCDNTIGALFKMGIAMALRNVMPVLAALMVTVAFFAVGVFVFWPVLLVAPGLASYCNAFLFNRIFDKYGMTLE
ncbi:MAG: YesL family protein [Subdoligranulum sp.]